VVRKAGLPETFGFGGRIWKAHQVHWTDVSETDPRTTIGGQIDKFVPVAYLSVNGHDIFRQKGADEALTDNIFLKAANLPVSAATNNPMTADPSKHRVAFVEYDASGDTMGDMDLSKTLTEARLAAKITHNGKTWVAKELQGYDADVFDEAKPMTEMIVGHQAFQETGDDDTMFVMADVPMNMSDSGAATTGTIFVRYERND